MAFWEGSKRPTQAEAEAAWAKEAAKIAAEKVNARNEQIDAQYRAVAKAAAGRAISIPLVTEMRRDTTDALAYAVTVAATAARPVPRAPVTLDPAVLREYREIADAVGFLPSEIAVESFKAFLAAKDMPVYSLDEVRPYMDEKAAKDSPHKLGWEWRPLRSKDVRPVGWGQASARYNGITFGPRGVAQQEDTTLPASDYYRAGVNAYDRLVPVHALKKVALIEREFRGDVAFFVSDYATAPHVKPDPFLMAVIPNPRVADGTGRFVIDIWDEPGFGIDRMIK